MVSTVSLAAVGPCPAPQLHRPAGGGYPRVLSLGGPLEMPAGGFMASGRANRVFLVTRSAATGGCSSALYVFNAGTAGVVAVMPIDGYVMSVTLDDEHDRLIVGTAAGGTGGQAHVLLIDTRTLQVLANEDVGSIVGRIVAVPSTGRALVEAGPNVCGSGPCEHEMRLRVLDVAKGRFLPDASATLGATFAVDGARQLVYTLDASGTLTAIDGRTGQEGWSGDVSPCGGDLLVVPGNGQIVASIGGHPGNYRYPAQAGYLCLISPTTHHIEVKLKEGPTAGLALEAADARARSFLAIRYSDTCPVGAPCAVDISGPVWVLDNTTGRTVHVIPEDARLAAVDGQTGRVFLLGTDGALRAVDFPGWKSITLARGVTAGKMILARRARRIWLLDAPGGTLTVACISKRC